jgi:hypothetical protein
MVFLARDMTGGENGGEAKKRVAIKIVKQNN